MARTVGAKDKKPRKQYVRKPKVIKLLASQVELAKKLDITPQQLAKEIVQMEKKPRKPRAPKIDWEKLAKDLQRALAMEIKENDGLKQQVTNANQLIIKMSGVIEYLEMKRGHNPV